MTCDIQKLVFGHNTETNHNVVKIAISTICIAQELLFLRRLSESIQHVYTVGLLSSKFIPWRILANNDQCLGKVGSRDQLTPPLPLKFGAEVRNCIWRWCRTGVKSSLMEMTTCLTISKISRSGIKIGVSCYDKTWSSVKKYLSSAWKWPALYSVGDYRTAHTECGRRACNGGPGSEPLFKQA